MRQFIKTQQELDTVCEKIWESGEEYISIDCETEEFTDEKHLPIQLELQGIGISDSKDQWYIPHNPEFNYKTFDTLVHLKKCVFHNAKFDLWVLEYNRCISFIDEIKVHDTLLLSYIDNSERMRHGLKYLAKEILGKDDVVKFKEVGKRPEKAFDLFSANDTFFKEQLATWTEKMGQYCMDDCQNTIELFFYFKNKFEKETPELWKLYEELEIPFMFVIFDMEKTGIFLDKGLLLEMRKKADKKLIELGAELYKEIGGNINLNSSHQISEILFNQKKYELPNDFRTDKGELSVDSKALHYLKETYKCRFCGLLLEYRELFKLQSTYIEALPKMTVDGIIHCSFNQALTKTGRLASSNPNLQNLPRRADDFNIRGAFKPKEGNVFVISDYSQIELRVLAYFSNDPFLVEAYKSGKDIHQATADKIGITRQNAKCFLEGTELLTDKGYKKIEEIINNTEKYLLLDFEGNNNKIIGTHIEPAYNLITFIDNFDSTKTITVTEDHSMIVNRDGVILRIPAKEVMETDSFIEIANKV